MAACALLATAPSAVSVRASARAVAQANTQAQDAQSALALWQKLAPLVAAGKADGARALAKGDPAAARALYRELLFDTATSRLYEHPSLDHAEEIRALLAETDEGTRALETRFAAWLKDPRPGVGFTREGAAVEQLIYLALVAHARDEQKEAGEGAPDGTPRELTERALILADSSGAQLAAAAFSGNLAVYALRERRPADVRPLAERAERIWQRWQHGVGLHQAPLLLGFAARLTEDWKTAAEQFALSAERGAKLPGVRRYRVFALDNLAAARRSLGDREGVRAALAAALEEQQKLLADAKTDEQRLNASKALADFEAQLGGSLTGLGRHTEAAEHYVRAEARKRENYRVESAQTEALLESHRSLWVAKIDSARTDEERKSYRGLLEQIVDVHLQKLDLLATQNRDTAMIVKVAERRLAIAREGGNPANVAKALEAVAGAHRSAGDLAKARAAAEEALRMRQADPRRAQIYNTLQTLGDIARQAEDWAAAAARYEEVIAVTRPGALPPPQDESAVADETLRKMVARSNESDRLYREVAALNARIGIASIRAKQGDLRAADELLTAAERARPRLYAAGAPDEADLVKWIDESNNPNLTGVDVAARRRQTGFMPDEDEQFRFTLAEVAAPAYRGILLSHRALLYEELNDLDRAAKTYAQAQAVNVNTAGGDFTGTETYVALARIERERGNYAAAEAPVAAAISEAARKNDASTVTHLLALQSGLRRDAGRYEEARQLADDALKIARGLGSRSTVAALLRDVGRAEGGLGGARLKPSEQHLRESLAMWRELGLRAQIAYTLTSLGQTLESAGRDDEAFASYAEAVEILEALAGSLGRGASAEVFSSGRANKELYERLIKLLIRRGRAAEAFQYLERSKSKALVDALAGAQVGAKDPALNAQLETARRAGEAARVADNELTAELAKTPERRDSARVAQLRARADSTRREYTEAVERIKRIDPSYAELVAVNATDINETRRHLPERALLVSYFPTGTELHIFLVTRDAAPAVRTVPLPRAELARMIAEYRKTVAPDDVTARGIGVELRAQGAGRERDLSAVNALTAKLYEALLAPAQAEIERAETILLVPAAEIYFLPLHALGRADAGGGINYLIETKRFAYLPSAGVLGVVARRAAVSTGEDLRQSGLLALGNPDGSLPGATAEVGAISQVFSQPKVFVGPEATVQRVAGGEASRAPFVHFATHGIIDSRDPKESYLLLAGTPPRLSVRDIVEENYKLSFAGTRLVTLSACNTNVGGGDPSATYGSLSRAFAKAGAPTVVASLWSVSDEATRDMMIVFYRELAAGQPKAEAMRRAQLAVKNDARYRHPFYWAPFVVLGEWR
ncbi:MAG TPA: CHAT domain-containing protein [Pyrinomonadaceae bacterium]|nr:CHAT domain-containing protein [Pyrinomonadaceae bacterium]